MAHHGGSGWVLCCVSPSVRRIVSYTITIRKKQTDHHGGGGWGLFCVSKNAKKLTIPT